VVSFSIKSKRDAFKQMKAKCLAVSGELLAVKPDQSGVDQENMESKSTKNSSCSQGDITEQVLEESKKELPREFETLWANGS
jgi:hypothetical protein